jgi:hypothetical protein
MTEYRLPTKSERRCQCGEIYTINRPHTCKARAATPQPKKLAAAPVPVSHVSPHTPGASPHIATPSPHEKKGAVARNLRWRAKNLDRHREYHTAYMRKWRAAKATNNQKELH